MTVADAFRQLARSLSTTYGEREAQSMTRIVFEDAFGIRNTSRENKISSSQCKQLADIQSRLLNGEPVQYVLGQARFYGLDLIVSPAVLIPRQETEELVFWILQEAGKGTHGPEDILIDIGTGSGCIVLALAKSGDFKNFWGIDISENALAIASHNAKLVGQDIHFQHADILEPESLKSLPKADILVSNPPYIPRSETGNMPAHVLDHEPEEALFVDHEDPLHFYKAILNFAEPGLRKGGWIYFELNEYSEDKIGKLLEKEGFSSIELKKDMQGKTRMARAQKPH